MRQPDEFEMLKPLAVKAVRVYLVEQDGPAAALVLAECEIFDPHPDLGDERLQNLPARAYQALYRSVRQRWDKARTFLELELGSAADGQPARTVSVDELRRLDQALEEVWRECAHCEQQRRALDEEARSIEQLSSALDQFGSLNVDLGFLRDGLRFLDVRIGAIARADVTRLRAALGLIGYSLTVFREGDDTAHVALAGVAGAESALQGVLESASFRTLPLPEEFHDTPQVLRQQLVQRRARLQDREVALAAHLQERRARYEPLLRGAAVQLRHAAPYARLADSLRSHGGLACASGWVPADRVEVLRRALHGRLGSGVVLQARDPLPEERLQVPSVIRYPRLLRPFAALVRNYGVPRYGEVDPTWLFALSFVLMFGMMFGDVGQGAVIAVAGLLLPVRWAMVKPFVVGVGVASTAFGFLYGSVFGYEHLLTPIWMSPLADPMRMLAVALGWGVAFILIASLITVRNRIVERRWREAIVDGKGLAGIGVYLAVLIGAWRWMTAGTLGAELVVGGISLAAIMGNLWSRTAAPPFERGLVTVLETFETLMGYVTNTLSFLRVAAFSLNHVALAVAVFTLAGMLDAPGHWLTVILGNVFILIVEGAIVAIQVLRLEYYEGFSRFFAGDGVQFRPLSLAPEPRPATVG